MCAIYIYKYHTYFFHERILQLFMRISLVSLGWNLKHATLLGILVYAYTYVVTCFYIICVCWMRICQITFYIMETFTFKLAKHKMATKMLRKPHIFFSLSQIKAQFVVSAIILIVNFCLVSLERNDFYLTFRSKTSAVFYVFTISILLNMLTIIWCLCGNIVD